MPGAARTAILAALAAVLGLGLVGAGLGMLQALALAAVAGVALVGVVALTNRSTPGADLLAGIVWLIAVGVTLGAAGAAILQWGSLEPLLGVLVIATIATATGFTATWWGGMDRTAVAQSLYVVLFAGVPLVCLVFALVVGDQFLRFGERLEIWEGYVSVTSTAAGDSVPDLSGLFGYLTVIGVTIAVTVRLLPLTELAANDRTAVVDHWTTAIEKTGTSLAGVSIVLWLVVSIARDLAPDTYRSIFETVPTLSSGLAMVINAPALRMGILAIVSVCWVAAIASLTLEQFSRLRGFQGLRRAPAMVGGIAVAGSLWWVYPAIYRDLVAPAVPDGTLERPGSDIAYETLLAPPDGISIIALSLIGAMALLWCCLGVLWLLTEWVTVETTSPGALAAIGLTGTAVGGAALGAHPVIVILVVALGILVWDITEYGLTAVAELEADAALGPQLVHLLGTTVICLVGVAGALGAVVGIELYIREAVSPEFGVAALLASGLALVLSVIVFRGVTRPTSPGAPTPEPEPDSPSTIEPVDDYTEQLHSVSVEKKRSEKQTLLDKALIALFYVTIAFYIIGAIVFVVLVM